MDPVTHGLAGGLLARSGLAARLLPEELQRRGVLWTAAFALAPDLDAVVELSGDPLAFLRHHRGFTHSLLGGGILALALTLLFGRLFPGVPRRRVFGLALAGIYLHVFLDLLTSYGTVLLYPFDSTRFTFDWLWTVDPTFTGILICGLVAVWLLRRAALPVAKVGVVLASGYILMCGVLQWHARQAVAAEVAALDIRGVTGVSVVPAPFVPLRWTGIVETADRYYRTHVDLATDDGASLRFVEVPKMAAAVDGRVMRAVESRQVRDQVRLYRWFARFPVVTVEEAGDGRVVRFHDLRFDLPGLSEENRPYVFSLWLNAAGRVIDTHLE